MWREESEAKREISFEGKPRTNTRLIAYQLEIRGTAFDENRRRSAVGEIGGLKEMVRKEMYYGREERLRRRRKERKGSWKTNETAIRRAVEH